MRNLENGVTREPSKVLTCFIAIVHFESKNCVLLTFIVPKSVAVTGIWHVHKYGDEIPGSYT